MAERDDIERSIRRALRACVPTPAAVDALDVSQPIADALAMDSLMFVTFLLELEQRFGGAVLDDVERLKRMRTIDDLVLLVAGRAS